MKRHLTHSDVHTEATVLAKALIPLAQVASFPLKVFPIPRGGIPAFYLVHAAFTALTLPNEDTNHLRLCPTDDIREADILMDDLYDSGETRHRYQLLNPRARFMCLIYKGCMKYPKGEWLVFPWEGTENKSIEDAFTRLLQFVGEKPEREGLIETPTRMAKAWKEWTSGYDQDPSAILKTFEDGSENYDEMIHTENIPFYSHCEHHLAPFFGTVKFAYIPDKRIVGLSKLSRLVDVFARRLQVQERLTTQIVEAFEMEVKPLGSACVIKGRHMCEESRGINRSGIITTTAALRGVFKTQAAARAEFYSL